ncbi:sugar transferase [Micromonospora zamorensis]|uniref:sugar transferase n=1 Tax=Micromonospora zamorensis TaxID=709883 RepID=UPI003CEBCC88
MTNALAHAFMGLYMDLMLLEARIVGTLEATEALIYVRQLDSGAQAKPLSVSFKARRTFWRVIKPLVERSIAALALFLLSPLLLAIAFAIKVDSRGPALFRQTRVGLSGKAFGFYKFRTMAMNADSLLAESSSHSEGGLMFKMRDDPRVTRVGRFLRRYALDELTSLINVVLGSLSLVGPRPALPAEAALYDERVSARLAVRPGLTGLWLISGASDLTWEEGIELDLDYVGDGSFRTDAKILSMTFGAVIGGRGLY